MKIKIEYIENKEGLQRFGNKLFTIEAIETIRSL